MNGRSLRSGTFAGRDEWDAALIALAELSYEHGYDRVSLEQVATRAGLGLEAIHWQFKSKEDCLVAAYEATTEQSFQAASDAYAAVDGGWAPGVHAALRALLGFFAGTPAFTHLYAVESVRVGRRMFEPRDHALERFIELLEPGYAEAGEDAPPRLASETIAGSFFELVRLYATREMTERLPEALTVISTIALAPFVGREEARRIAAPGG